MILAGPNPDKKLIALIRNALRNPNAWSEIENYKSNSKLYKELKLLKKDFDDNYYSKSSIEEQVDQLNEVLVEYAKQNYSAKVELPEDDLFNSIAFGIYLLGEQLTLSTVNHEYLQDIFNSLEEILIVIDKKGIIKFINTAAESVLLYKQDELIGQPLFNNVVENIDFNELLDQDKKKNVSLINRDGDKIQVLLNVSKFLNGDKKNIGLILIAHDLTQLLHYQHEIVEQNLKIIAKNEELQEINKKLLVSVEKSNESDRLKSTFLANMSHEVRTPLNSVYGFSQLLLEEDVTEHERRNYYAYIINNTHKLLAIINDIIELSKIEAGELKVSYTSVSINKLLENLYVEMQPKFFGYDEKNVTLQLELPDNGSNIHVLTDEIRLGQILSNLLNNALKFTPEGLITFGYTVNNEKNSIEFFVKDTGIGISKENFSLIFERFRQVEEGLTRNYSGSGLGLSICKTLVEILGGTIWVNSEENKGAEFIFTIPLNKSTKQKTFGASINKMESYNWEGKNVLIVEDDEGYFVFLEKILLQTKINITHVVTGDKAIEAIKSESIYDIVLMDVHIPVIDGYEATRQIKLLRPELPIIAQTANAMDEDYRRAIDSGCDDYIAKPINKQRLLRLMNQYIQN
jgi:PAS domain S-box-containing protein